MSESCYYIWDIVLTSISILATVALSIIAVWQNSRYKKLADRKDEIRTIEQKEENRLRIRPYLFTVCEEQPYETFGELGEKDYIEMDGYYKETFRVNSNTSIPIDIQEQSNTDNAAKQAILALSMMEKYCLMEYKIQNVGNGTAINIKMLINGQKTFEPFALRKNADKSVYFLFNLEDYPISSDKIFDIEIFYEDIENSTKYQQTERISLRKEVDSGFLIHIIEKSENISLPMTTGKGKS